MNPALHSTMFLLILGKVFRETILYKTLHSTMFLLILEPAPGTGHINNFTFHNVSINTPKADIYVAYNTSLHSTMFLLIRIPETQDLLSGSVFTFHNVSINTSFIENFCLMVY